MNRIKLVLFWTLAITSLGLSYAENVTIDNITYDISSGNAVITEVDMTGTIYIPTEITFDDITYPVTEISSNVFPDVDEPDFRIVFDGGIERLFSMTFAESWAPSDWKLADWEGDYSQLQIPYSVERIPDYAFENCSSIVSVEYSRSYYSNSVGNYAFYNCKNLESVRFNWNIESIGEHAFDGCASECKIQFYDLDSFFHTTFGQSWAPAG